MKQNKDKQIEIWRFGCIFACVVLFIVSISLGYFIAEGIKLEQELQSCQDKVPVWTLKANCWSWFEFEEVLFTMDFVSYEEYKKAIGFIIEKGNCEVLE